MTEAAKTTSSAEETADLATSDDVCISCGYVLCGLSLTGACPECALPIHRSRRGDHLMYADPRWLRKLLLGQTMMAGGLVVVVSLPFVTFGLALLAMPVAGAAMVMVPAILGVLVLIGLIAMLCGGFLVTLQDPRETEIESPLSARRVARAALLAGVGAALFGVAIEHLITRGPIVDTTGRILARLVLPGLLLVLAIAWLRWAALLARRMRADELARLTRGAERHLWWLGGTMILLGQIVDLANSLGPNMTTVAARDALRITADICRFASVIIGLVLLLRAIRIAVVSVRLQKQLTACHRAARTYWKETDRRSGPGPQSAAAGPAVDG